GGGGGRGGAWEGPGTRRGVGLKGKILDLSELPRGASARSIPALLPVFPSGLPPYIRACATAPGLPRGTAHQDRRWPFQVGSAQTHAGTSPRSREARLPHSFGLKCCASRGQLDRLTWGRRAPTASP